MKYDGVTFNNLLEELGNLFELEIIRVLKNFLPASR